MDYAIKYFSFHDSLLVLDDNGKTPGILITHTNQVDGQEVTTGAQEAYILSDLRVNYLSDSGANIFKRYIKASPRHDFALASFNDSGVPHFDGEPFIVNSKVVISNDYFCDIAGSPVPFNIAVKHDENGEPVSNSDGPVLNDGYFGIYDFHFNNIAKSYLISPVLNLLISRLDNKE